MVVLRPCQELSTGVKIIGYTEDLLGSESSSELNHHDLRVEQTVARPILFAAISFGPIVLLVLTTFQRSLA